MCVTAAMAVNNSDHRTSKRVQLDRSRLQDSEAVSKFQKFLKDPPCIPWHVGVGSHLDQLTKWMQEGAKNCFPKPRSQPRQRYMSDFTWQWAQLRKQLLRIARQTFAHADMIFLRVWFLQWKCHVPGLQPGFGLMPACALVSLRQQCFHFGHWLLYQRAKFHVIARSSSKRDRIHCASAMVQQFYDAAQGHDSRAIYRALRPLLGQQGRKSHMNCMVRWPRLKKLLNNGGGNTFPAQSREFP